MYSLVEPYDAKISPANTGYVLTLSENGTDFVLDYSCTTKIDYWLCEVDVKKVALVDPCK